MMPSMTTSLLSLRAQATRPFHVMELLSRSAEREKRIGPSVSMVVGEPDFPAPPDVVRAAERALALGRIHYTHALGMPALREAIAADYTRRDGLTIDPDRIAVTAGGSGALLLLMLALLDSGDEVLMPDPSYPCNRAFVEVAGGRVLPLPVDASSRYQPSPEAVRAAWTPRTKALLLASPANPTGTLVSPEEAGRLRETVRSLGGVLVVDEIYQRLVFDSLPPSLLSLGDDVITINSFSKTYSMTGWRLGWAVMPPSMISAVERLAQNLFISPSSLAQAAALGAFTPDSLAVAESYRLRFRDQGVYLLGELQRAGFHLPVMPDGAFYGYCDVSSLTDDSYRFCLDLCDNVGVLMAPGCDFGDHDTRRHVRVSFTKPIDVLAEGVKRLHRFLGI
jgi:aspartate/methionine/tyrosine aminotransferase